MFEHSLIHYLEHYGSMGLYLLLAFGIIGLPIPDESLLIMAGLLSAKGHLNPYVAYPAVLLGSMSGITVSYFIGFFMGKNLLIHYGSFLGLNAGRLETVHSWFEHYGKWLLPIGYFIPGIRHLSGVLMGTLYMNYFQFALWAYFGALLWTLLFFFIGFSFYDAWNHWQLRHLLA